MNIGSSAARVDPSVSRRSGGVMETMIVQTKPMRKTARSLIVHNYSSNVKMILPTTTSALPERNCAMEKTIVLISRTKTVVSNNNAKISGVEYTIETKGDEKSHPH